MTELECVDGVVASPEGQLTVGLYSFARVVGDTVYIAGHTALAPDGSVAHPGDPEAQMRYTLDGIAATLATVGATLNDMVQLRLYLTDLRDRARILAIRREYFQGAVPRLDVARRHRARPRRAHGGSRRRGDHPAEVIDEQDELRPARRPGHLLPA